MPTENEFKFILSTDSERDVGSCSNVTSIRQGYLTSDGSVRIRHYANRDEDRFVLTYKKNVNDWRGVARLIEIEADMDHRDFDDLWKRVADKKVHKVRYELIGFPGWTVDYFLGKYNQIYLCMAEVELPEGHVPSGLPECLDRHLIYSVAKEDTRFFNANLYDEEAVYKLLQELK